MDIGSTQSGVLPDGRQFEWRGWEYENRAETHMIKSKRHLFIDGRAACGVRVQPCGASTREGDECCGRCMNISYKMDEAAG
jgi:hypothetical protein